ncbi:MAG: hypothetical protein AAGI24_05140 [Pseudomonadota bacterium]
MTTDSASSAAEQAAAIAEHPALQQMLSDLRARHSDAINGVLVYGSCLRTGDIFDGLLDLYLLCSDYTKAYQSAGLTLANRLLPPNVFYVETLYEGHTLRGKVTLISLADFSRGCSRAWFESYLWGRFAQPTLVAWCCDAATEAAIEESLNTAANTLLERSLPLLPANGSVLSLWQAALALSYGTELRTERSGRAQELVQANAAYYQATAQAHSGSLSFPFQVYDDRYDCTVPVGRRKLAVLAWALRRVQGKLLSVLRLVKALYTFEGGLDYIAWKLERHSGQPVAIPDRVRQRPLIHMWGFFWGLYRRGIFK